MKWKLLASSGAVIATVLAVWAFAAGDEMNVSYVAVKGELTEPQRADVYRVLIDHRQTLHDIGDVKMTLEQSPWIHRVDVRRDWPDGIVVSVLTEHPIAFWNNDAYINADGKVFTSKLVSATGLPQLFGPKDSEREVMQRYLELGSALTGSGQAVDTLTLDERGSWAFTTSRGMRVLLGKDDTMERLQRFLAVLGSGDLKARIAQVKQVDTRYSNGVAISFKDTGLDIATTDNTQRELRL
ncbi:MAG: cell division protein FtsQ/DivIB [Pseudomonadales bacterium]|nr:cell division protein FtsQ/DivIB [Pseudomonadales bacterium]